MIMIMVMIIFPILAITDWLWQIGISSSPKLHLDVPKSRLELIFLLRFQQRSVHKIPPRRCSILISNVLWNAYELLTFFYARKDFDIETKMGGEAKNINFFLVFNFFNNLLHINHRAKDSLFIAFILEQIFVYDI